MNAKSEYVCDRCDMSLMLPCWNWNAKFWVPLPQETALAPNRGWEPRNAERDDGHDLAETREQERNKHWTGENFLKWIAGKGDYYIAHGDMDVALLQELIDLEMAEVDADYLNTDAQVWTAL